MCMTKFVRGMDKFAYGLEHCLGWASKAAGEYFHGCRGLALPTADEKNQGEGQQPVENESFSVLWLVAATAAIAAFVSCVISPQILASTGMPVTRDINPNITKLTTSAPVILMQKQTSTPSWGTESKEALT